MKSRLYLSLLLLVAADSWAVDTDEMNESIGQVERHLQSMESEAWPDPHKAMQGAVKFFFGNEQWRPGEEFVSGNDWLALSCQPTGCLLEAATLSVKQESSQGHYDVEPSQGQHLIFKRKNSASGGEVVAWFHTTGAPAWLKSGPVPTYYASPFPAKTSKKPGTFEIEIAQAKGGALLLVPMILSGASGLPTKNSSPSYLLQLRASGKRQLLLGYLASCHGHIDSIKYLQWSGDLDRDGTPDYLISFIDAYGPVHLYLSSFAKDEQLVGLAGVYNSPETIMECDPEGV